jgi:hypothetical protein
MLNYTVYNIESDWDDAQSKSIYRFKKISLYTSDIIDSKILKNVFAEDEYITLFGNPVFFEQQARNCIDYSKSSLERVSDIIGFFREYGEVIDIQKRQECFMHVLGCAELFCGQKCTHQEFEENFVQPALNLGFEESFIHSIFENRMGDQSIFRD